MTEIQVIRFGMEFATSWDMETATAWDNSAQALLRLLGQIDCIGGNASGTIFFGEPTAPNGFMVVHRGKIAWAFDRRHGDRLAQLLLAAAPRVSEHTLRQVISYAEGSQQSLTTLLLNTGILSRHGLREVFLRHTVECAALLAERQEAPAWQQRARDTFDVEFSFTTAEVAIAHATLDAPERLKSELSKLEGCRSAQCVAVALKPDADGEAQPLATLGIHQAKVLTTLTQVANEWVTLQDPAPNAVYWRRAETGVECMWVDGEVAYLVHSQNELRPLEIAEQLQRDLRHESAEPLTSGVFTRPEPLVRSGTKDKRREVG